PLAIEVMKEINVDLNGRATKAVKDVSGLGFDFVITLCDRSRAECPKFPGAETVHWQFPNPLVGMDRINEQRMFRSLRDQIAQRIRLFALVQVRFNEVDLSADPNSILVH